MTFETLQNDMNVALKNGDKMRRAVISDIVATIQRTAAAGKKRIEIDENFVDEMLIKYKKTAQEMIDTCPTDRVDTLAEYQARMEIVMEYAPKTVDNIKDIKDIIYPLAVSNNIVPSSKNKSALMKLVMPVLKTQRCDMKVAQQALAEVMKETDAVMTE